MVFLGGPRQVGKTTFAQSLLPHYQDTHPGYLNWDNLEDRKKIQAGAWPREQRLIVFDEIHKFA
jgi:predicted AAA+ superfamily ATPase